MEWKIGEIFEYNGEWYQCVVAIDGCRECYFRAQDYCTRHSECLSDVRSDGISVIFKKLEKVGEPIEFARGLYFQRYQLTDSTAFYEGDTRLFFNAPTKTFVYIEIKTKEDMEEKNNAKHSNSEKIGKNLKEFDLEAAKSGKPVCTRDGRKARIICFDRRGDKFPIVALLDGCNEEHSEVAETFTNEGLYEIGKKSSNDLMILPEKKEGWINVYKERCYETKEEAIRHIAPGTHYIDTIRVEWEDKE